MRWGVTYSALLVNGVFTMEVFLLTKNLLTLALALPIHGICALLCARDARFFDLLLLWGRTRIPALLANARFWKVEQLLAVDARPAGRARAAPDLRAMCVDFAAQECRPMNALPKKRSCAGESSRRERIPYAAHVSPHVVKTTLRGLRAGLSPWAARALSARTMRRSTPGTSG